MTISKSTFGQTANNETVSLYRIENSRGAYITLTDLGCRIVNIYVPDKNDVLTDVALGYSTLEDYLTDDASMGAVVGRHANRIKNGKFSLNGTDYTLAINNGTNHLHGGPTGFAHRIWESKCTDDKVTFFRTSTDGEEGYPGNLEVSVTYGFTEDNEISIAYEATADKDTIFNITNHAYFNLNGEGNGTVLNHELMLDADQTTEIDSTLIPTGTFLSVEGTPFDFRTLKTVGQDMVNDNSQFNIPETYDHNFVLNGTGLREAAILQSKESGIRMTCFTDQPGIQIYVPACTVKESGVSGKPYEKASAICLETQHYPDSINHDNFPSIVLKAGESFKTKTLYHFSVL